MPYTEHPNITSPTNEEAKTWRYLDLSQFMSILERECLHFNRVDRFIDPFEGTFPKANYEKRDEIIEIYERWTEQMEEENSFWDEEQTDYILETVKDKPLGAGFDGSRFIFLNCWHLNEKESAAMWDIYLKSDEGIAIQSTFGKMKRAFQAAKEEVYIGKVRYIDYKEQWVPESNTLYRFLHKRESFEHERELRAIVHRSPPSEFEEFDEEVQAPRYALKWEEQPTGIYVSTAIDELIEGVYVAPTSPRWIYELVKDITSTYGIDCEVTRSKLYDNPPQDSDQTETID